MSEAETVAELVRESIDPKLVEIGDGRRVLVVAETACVREVKPFLDAYLEKPERRKGVSRHQTLSSLIAHVNRQKSEASAIFAEASPDCTGAKIVAVYDYHPAGEDQTKADWGEYRAIYPFPLSSEWSAWIAGANKPMSQGQFAAFLDERLLDVADPANVGKASAELAERLGVAFASPSTILSVARGLSVRVQATVANATVLETGETKFVYETEHKGPHGGPLNVPSAFCIAVPVFRGDAAYSVAVRLRYTVDGGRIAWQYSLHRADRVFEHAFEQACARVQKETSLPIFVGRAEGGPMLEVLGG